MGGGGAIVENDMKCTNWGCDANYQADRNNKKICRHHSGRFEFGSEHGLWAEGWTCCRGTWDSQGCTIDVHRGQPRNRQLRFCINHGQSDPNPKSKSPYPSSFCGKPFFVDASGKDLDDSTCVYHPGYLRITNRKTGDGVWSCCQSDEKDNKGCTEGSHKFVDYPDEDAKKYFFDRALRNPSDNWKGNPNGGKTDFELYGRYCGFFRNAQPYQPKNPSKPKVTLTADEEKKMNLKDKICLNWSCGKIYKNSKNHKKACKCHPGRWDFGYTAPTV